MKRLFIFLLIFIFLFSFNTGNLVQAQESFKSNSVTTKVGNPQGPPPDVGGGTPFTPLPGCVAAKTVVPALNELTYPGGSGVPSTCGPTSAAMVLQSLGLNTSIQQVTQEWGTAGAWNHDVGFTGWKIPAAINGAYPSVQADRTSVKSADDAKRLIQQTGNAIFLSVYYNNDSVPNGLDKKYDEGSLQQSKGGISTGGGVGHMLVVYQVCADRVYIVDPLGGEKYNIPVSQFNSAVGQGDRGEAFTLKLKEGTPPPSSEFVKPARGVITTCFLSTNPPYSATNPHKGYDIGAPEGSDVVAAADGKVIKNAYDQFNGYHVFIDHGGGLTSSYLHFRERGIVQEGQTVTKGQKIGVVGNTGASTGAHLHFQLQRNGELQDPGSFYGINSCVEGSTQF